MCCDETNLLNTCMSVRHIYLHSIAGDAEYAAEVLRETVVPVHNSTNISIRAYDNDHWFLWRHLVSRGCVPTLVNNCEVWLAADPQAEPSYALWTDQHSLDETRAILLHREENITCQILWRIE